jgi:hypothetical protein
MNTSQDLREKDTSPLDDFFRFIQKARGLSPLSFLVVLALFSFPFMNISCSGESLATLSGKELMIGADQSWETGAALGGYGLGLDESEETSMPPNIWAIIAFLGALGGMLTIFFRGKYYLFNALGVAAAGISILGMNMLRWTATREMDQLQFEEFSGMLQFSFMPAYWVALTLLYSAACIGLYRLFHTTTR